MTVVNELRALPLFRGIPEASLAELVAAFRPESKRAGTVLFRPGDLATHFDLVAKGEIVVEEEGSVKFTLRPVSPLGELGAFTGIPRCTKATATTDVDLLSIQVGDLLGFFDRHGDVGFAFTKNLLDVVSEKLRRDRRMLGEMRQNIIKTQKAMKTMRELVLESPETTLSKPLFETLDGLIGNNRRANYRVVPPASFAAHVKSGEGKATRSMRVMEISEGYLKIEGSQKDVAPEPNDFTAVLVTPTAEILVSGAVVREGEGGTVVRLDPMIDDYTRTLDDYVTRIQLLDYVV